MKYYLKFDDNNNIKEIIPEKECNQPDTEIYKVGAYEAPSGFDPNQDMCKLDNGVVRYLTPQEIQEFVNENERQMMLDMNINLLNSMCEQRILKKYSRDDQRNIDRDALHLKALEAIDSARLKPEEVEWLKTHKEMSNYINNKLKIARELKAKIKTMSYEQLKEFDPQDDSNFKGLE